MAGAQSVLGCFCPTFQKCEDLGDGVIINKIAAGFSHCAAAAASGELYCWGRHSMRDKMKSLVYFLRFRYSVCLNACPFLCLFLSQFLTLR